MKKISVIIPVYNSENYLHNCIKSVLSQDYTNLEVILINDGSYDLSKEICEHFSSIDNRVITINKENGGVSSARNAGLKIASGDYIAFVDSDDELEKDMYSVLVHSLEKWNSEIAHCGYKRVNEANDVINEVSGTGKVLVQKPVEAIYCLLNGINYSCGLWNKLFKREVIKGLFFSEELSNNEDVLFNVEAFYKATQIVFVDETKYLYYEHSSSACNQMDTIRQAQDSVIACERMVQRIPDDSIREIVYPRLFQCRINLFRNLLLKSKSFDKEKIRDEKQVLLEAFSLLTRPTFREIFNLYCLIYFTNGYKFMYQIYDKIRKPNWDVESGI